MLGHGGTCPLSRFTCCPQIQKLDDRSDVIFEVPKFSEIQIFRGYVPDPDGGAYSTLPDPLIDGRRLVAPCQELHPAVGPSGLVSTVSESNPLQSWQPY